MSSVVYYGDCLDVMDYLIDQGIKVDAIITDIPYGTTANPKDVFIPFAPMWDRINKINNPKGVVVLFSDGFFTSRLKMSNPKMWRYDRVWDKQLLTGHLNANHRPMRQTETICVFSKKLATYNPQKVKGGKPHSRGTKNKYKQGNYGKHDNFNGLSPTQSEMKHPTSLISIQKPHPSIAVHLTEKPVLLMEELVKTYTNEGELVLDFTCGSGTTGVACKKLNRKFIGIDNDKHYCRVTRHRIRTTKVDTHE